MIKYNFFIVNFIDVRVVIRRAFTRSYKVGHIMTNIVWIKSELNITRYDYNLTIMKSPKRATDNRFKQ